MDWGSYTCLQATYIKEASLMDILTDTESITGTMGIHTKDITRITSDMVMANIHGPMEIYMKGIFQMA